LIKKIQLFLWSKLLGCCLCDLVLFGCRSYRATVWSIHWTSGVILGLRATGLPQYHTSSVSSSSASSVGYASQCILNIHDITVCWNSNWARLKVHQGHLTPEFSLGGDMHFHKQLLVKVVLKSVVCCGHFVLFYSAKCTWQWSNFCIIRLIVVIAWWEFDAFVCTIL